MLMAGTDPVVRLPAGKLPDNDLDDELLMDENERLDFADQQPLLPLLQLEGWDQCRSS
jgi:hypothetical protein